MPNAIRLSNGAMACFLKYNIIKKDINELCTMNFHGKKYIVTPALPHH